MTFSEFKRETAKELRGIYYAMLGVKYVKKAYKVLHKDRELAVAFKGVSEVYEKRARETGGNWPKGIETTE